GTRVVEAGEPSRSSGDGTTGSRPGERAYEGQDQQSHHRQENSVYSRQESSVVYDTMEMGIHKKIGGLFSDKDKPDNEIRTKALKLLKNKIKNAGVKVDKRQTLIKYGQGIDSYLITNKNLISDYTYKSILEDIQNCTRYEILSQYDGDREKDK